MEFNKKLEKLWLKFIVMPCRTKKEEEDQGQEVDLLEGVGDIQGADLQVLTDLVGAFIEEVNT